MHVLRPTWKPRTESALQLFLFRYRRSVRSQRPTAHSKSSGPIGSRCGSLTLPCVLLLSSVRSSPRYRSVSPAPPRRPPPRFSKLLTSSSHPGTGPEGQISSVNAHSKIKDYGQANMKEICYRNLYADLGEWTP